MKVGFAQIVAIELRAMRESGASDSAGLLSYARPGTQRSFGRLPFTFVMSVVVVRWAITIGLLTWSNLAISHFQRVAGQEALWSTPASQTYETWGINVQSVIGLAAFLGFPVVLIVISIQRHYPVRLWWLLLISHAVAFVILIGGLFSLASVVYP